MLQSEDKVPIFPENNVHGPTPSHLRSRCDPKEFRSQLWCFYYIRIHMFDVLSTRWVDLSCHSHITRSKMKLFPRVQLHFRGMRNGRQVLQPLDFSTLVCSYYVAYVCWGSTTSKSDLHRWCHFKDMRHCSLLGVVIYTVVWSIWKCTLGNNSINK